MSLHPQRVNKFRKRVFYTSSGNFNESKWNCYVRNCYYKQNWHRISSKRRQVDSLFLLHPTQGSKFTISLRNERSKYFISRHSFLQTLRNARTLYGAILCSYIIDAALNLRCIPPCTKESLVCIRRVNFLWNTIGSLINTSESNQGSHRLPLASPKRTRDKTNHD